MKNIVFVVLTVFSATILSCKKSNILPQEQPAVMNANTETQSDINASLNGQLVVVKANGDIQDNVDAFRNKLGPLNTTPGQLTGRREINWDGVPDSLNEKPLPVDFFNQTGKNASASLQRGITYSSIGRFMVSNDGFKGLNDPASSQFSAFSGTKTFANVASARWDVSFRQAGTNINAAVPAFGLVFSDVDLDNSTSLEFYDGDKCLGKYFVPKHNSQSSFSFLGVYCKSGAHITKVKVSHDGFLLEGTKDISQNGTRDLIVLDDFIYGEPR